MRRFALYASVVMLAACSVSVVWAEDAEQTTPEVIYSENGLAGLREVKIVVERLDPEGERRTGLTREQLQTALTAAVLGSRTVKVVTDKDKHVPACIYLSVGLGPMDKVPSTLYCIKLHLCQRAYVLRSDGQWLWVPLAATWSPPIAYGLGPDDEVAQQVKDKIRDKVDKFTIEYFKENPQPGAPEQPAVPQP